MEESIGEIIPGTLSDLASLSLIKPAPLDTEPTMDIQSTLTEGTKFDANKVPLDLLDPVAIIELGKVLQFGAVKYAPHNWRKGIKVSRLLAALLRHVVAYLSGEDKDPETGLSHIAHAMCCCMFILGTEHMKEFDDRYKPTPKTSEGDTMNPT